nr:unnamed protein product [Digitaria exilis]
MAEKPATPGGAAIVAPALAPAVDAESPGGGRDAEVSLSNGKPRRRGFGRRLTLAPAPVARQVSFDGRGTGSAASRPWRGPLPPVRVSPCLTLAEVLARVQPSPDPAGGGHDPGGVSACAPISSPATSGALEGRRLGSPFRAPTRPATRDPGGRSGDHHVGPGRALLLSLGGRKAHFAFSDGLCSLFANAGQPRGFSSPARAPPVCVVDSSASSIQGAASPALVSTPSQTGTALGSTTHPGSAMDHRGAGLHGSGGGRGEDGEQFFGDGGDFPEGGLGFDPGYGGG